MNVLVCEDNQEILDLIEVVLISDGHIVLKSMDRINSIDQLKKNDVELIVIDYWLKTEKADLIINYVRNLDKYKNIPIIMISAIVDLDKVGAKLKLNAILRKPFNILDLKNLVNQYSNNVKKDINS